MVIDSDTLQVIERDLIPWDGPWAECKGGNSQQEMQQANQVSQQQLQQQAQYWNMVNPSLQKLITNGGMLPQQQAAMTSQAINGLGQQYQQMYGNLSNTLAARGITGGENAGAGQLAQSFGALGAQEAGQQSQLLNQIQLAKGQNLMGALGLGSQNAATTGQAGISSLGIGQQAAQATDQAQTGFWGSLVGGLAGLGSAGILKCWVAAELYGGWMTPETVAIRSWLTSTWYMAPFTVFYRLVGPDWAALIRKSPRWRRYTKRLFDSFLRIANE